MFHTNAYFRSPLNALGQYIQRNIKLSIPIIAGQLSTVAMGITDTLYVGKLGRIELAAGGVCNSVFFFFCILGIGLLSGMSPLVSREEGSGNPEKGYRFLTAGMRAAWLASAVIALLSLLMAWQFHWLGQSAEVNAISPRFLSIIALSTFPLLIFLAVKGFADGKGFTRIGMVITVCGVLLNWVLNECLIFGRGPFPALGFEGAAMATLCTRLLSAAAMLVWLFLGRYKPTQPFWFARKYNHEEFKEFIKIGLPSAFQYFFEVGAFSGAAVMIGFLGPEYSAAHNIAIQIAGLTYMIALGFSIAGSIEVGQAVGEKDAAGVRKAGIAAILLIVLFETITCGTLIVFRDELAQLFIDDANVLFIASQLLLVAAFFQWSDGLQCVALGLLRARGDVNIPTVVTFFSYWLVALPLGAYMIFELHSATGFWIALLAALSCSALLLNIRFFWLKKDGTPLPAHG